MGTKTKGKKGKKTSPCPICNEQYTNVSSHMRGAHADVLPPDGWDGQLPGDKNNGHKEEENIEESTLPFGAQVNPEDIVAKIIYEQVVKPICEAHRIEIQSWDDLADKTDYYDVAGRIRSAMKRTS